MNSTWKQIYPQIKAAVSNLTSLEGLLQEVVGAIALAFNSDCLLWTGLERGSFDKIKVYATLEAFNINSHHAHFVVLKQADTSLGTIWQLQPQVLPEWFGDQQHTPALMELSPDELLVPVVHEIQPRSIAPQPGLVSGKTLQLVLQLRRRPGTPEAMAASPNAESAAPSTWSVAEQEALEVLGSQLGLAYSALYWHERLEDARQQAALVGRIAHLLNSSLNPDEIVGRIVAELGQGLQCDRSILVDLRDDPVNILATWDHPQRELLPFESYQIERKFWRNVVEMLTQGGASYWEVMPTMSDLDPLQDWLQEIGAASALIVPLFIQEEFFGAVSLLSYRGNRIYAVDELQTLRQVADQAAIALTNAQHYQSLWHRQEALRLQNNSLQLEIIRDELTHLMNRRSLERELEQLSTKAVWVVQSAFSIIVCDIDYFKLVNDTHGHLVGDEVLKTLAKRMMQQLRRKTPAYRYGGEEFVVILAETPLTQAIDVAERLRQMIRATPMKTAKGAIAITASFGVAQQDPHRDQHAWDVLRRADQALYEAKRQGRDRVNALP